MAELTLFDLDLQPTEQAARGPSTRATPHLPPPRPARGPRLPTVLAVDGNSLAHRAFHAYPSGPGEFTDSDGRPRGAVYGFLALLAGICDRVDPAAVVVGFDCGRSSQRRDTFPPYKAQRPDKDPGLLVQLDDLEWLLERLGVHVVRPAGWEADDVLASTAAAAEAVGWRCVVATSDRDSYALISPSTSVLRLASGLDQAVEVDAAGLHRSTGVRAEQYTEFAALRGDASDNIPGIPGIGPKRAALLLAEYPTVADAAADPHGCRSVLGRPAGRTLLDDLADPATSIFHRNVALMSLRRDLPVDLDAGRRSVTPEDAERYLLAVELPTIVRRVQVALAVRPELPPPPSEPPS
jgi:DNA polymerase-1